MFLKIIGAKRSLLMYMSFRSYVRDDRKLAERLSLHGALLINFLINNTHFFLNLFYTCFLGKR